mmetsp:Transcript_8135/g.23196  ORF Transcript_8135/g.23196 Transcript_8135/m.23196 type:complete len:203 (+) Transcript_8135:238-846(+)
MVDVEPREAPKHARDVHVVPAHQEYVGALRRALRDQDGMLARRAEAKHLKHELGDVPRRYRVRGPAIGHLQVTLSTAVAVRRVVLKLHCDDPFELVDLPRRPARHPLHGVDLGPQNTVRRCTEGGERQTQRFPEVDGVRDVRGQILGAREPLLQMVRLLQRLQRAETRLLELEPVLEGIQNRQQRRGLLQISPLHARATHVR